MENDNLFSALTPAEIERLAILAEEAAEVQQIAMKIIRHGYDSYHPEDEDKTTNRDLLAKELGDLEYIIKQMKLQMDVDVFEIRKHRLAKAKKIVKYLHHN